jgi:hypothetical protein
MDKIEKDLTKPSPGDYNTLEAFNRTQSGNRKFKIGT